MFHLVKKAATTVGAAAVGKLRLFVDVDGMLKSRDENGTLITLGDGISSISLISTVGLNKTYRVTRQSGDTFDFVVSDGAAGADGVDGAVQSVIAGTGISTSSATGDITIANTGVIGLTVNGGAVQTGVVNLANSLSATTSSVFASTANSTAIQTVLSLAVPSGYLTAGKTFRFDLDGTQSQSNANTNVVVSIAVNGTQLVSAAVAGGNAAQTNRSIRANGSIMWNGTSYFGNLTTGISGILPIGAANVAGVAVSAATAHNIEIRVQTSTANAANIIRVAACSIAEVG